jgi:6-pyruvoyl-tetrahydropterin synthase
MSELKTKPIGGFLELEVRDTGLVYHENAIALTNGRACLSYIVKQEKIKKVYLPYYSCYALYEPFIKNNVEIEYYSINEKFEPVEFPLLNESEFFVYINYFGLKQNLISNLIEKYGESLIIDDTQDFYQKGYKGKAYSFSSARKYFGVPDGAFLYLPNNKKKEPILENFNNISFDHLVMRLEGDQEKAYHAFTEYEKTLGCDILGISKSSKVILSNLDYKLLAEKRNENTVFLCNALKEFNLISNKSSDIKSPLYFPFLPKNKLSKKSFYDHKIFVPTLWPDILERENINNFQYEKKLALNMIPLPIDHRYGIEEMTRVVELIKSFY